MGMVSIPVRLTIAETGAVALLEVAEELAAASDATKFVAALDVNHRLWLALSEMADRQGWTVPDRRSTDFVLTSTRYAGRGIKDDHVEALVGINREVSAFLSEGRDHEAIRARAVLAWQESGEDSGVPLTRWLISEIDRKGRITH